MGDAAAAAGSYLPDIGHRFFFGAIVTTVGAGAGCRDGDASARVPRQAERRSAANIGGRRGRFSNPLPAFRYCGSTCLA